MPMAKAHRPAFRDRGRAKSKSIDVMGMEKGFDVGDDLVVWGVVFHRKQDFAYLTVSVA
jgi:hypothetical protein